MVKNDCCTHSLLGSEDYKVYSPSLLDRFKAVAKIEWFVSLDKPQRVKQHSAGKSEYEIQGWCTWDENCHGKITLDLQRNIMYCRKRHAGCGVLDAMARSSGAVAECKFGRGCTYSKEEWARILAEARKCLDE